LHDGVAQPRSGGRVRRVAPLLLNVRRGRLGMTDLLFIAVTVAFFALAAAYVRRCDTL
jgi:hypothetical protein